MCCLHVHIVHVYRPLLVALFIYGYITHKEMDEVTKVWLFVVQIEKATSTEEMINELETKYYSFRFDCGFNKPQSAITSADKQTFLRSVWLHYVVYSELQQFRDGLLQTLQIEHLVHDHPDIVWSLLAYKENELTAGFIQDLYEVHYSPKGSNDIKDEQAVIMNWYTFLLECEGNLIAS